jgi:hypothetical protein
VKRDECTEPILIRRGMFNLWAVSELMPLLVRPNKREASHHSSLKAGIDSIPEIF